MGQGSGEGDPEAQVSAGFLDSERLGWTEKVRMVRFFFLKKRKLISPKAFTCLVFYFEKGLAST